MTEHTGSMGCGDTVQPPPVRHKQLRFPCALCHTEQVALLNKGNTITSELHSDDQKYKYPLSLASKLFGGQIWKVENQADAVAMGSRLRGFLFVDFFLLF